MSSRYRKLLAAAVGLLMVGLPLAGFGYWVADRSDQQGQDKVEAAAQAAIALVDERLGTVAASMDELAVAGVGCTADGIDLLRRAAFATGAAKAFAIVDADGNTLCGDPALAAEPAVAGAGMSTGGDKAVELVRVAERPLLRVRQTAGPGPLVAALVAPELLLAQAPGRRGAPQLVLTLGEGIPIAASGAESRTETGRVFRAAAHAAAHGVSAAASLPASDLSSHIEVREMEALLVVTVAIGVFCICWLLRRGRGENPLSELAEAVASGQLVPYFQPVVDIRSGRLRGVEVLLRWRKPDGTVLPPVAFLPLLESTGLIIEATRRLMIAVRDEIGPALRHRPYMRVAFNLTAQHLADDGIVRDVRGIFEASPMRLSQIVLEVTERQPLGNLAESRAVIAALQALGVKIALDDVGTGHSGLSYMLKLGVDIIKIDKMFIDAVSTDRNSATIIETLIELAHNMRMEVVAEGVETFEQVLFLRDLGVRSAQGFVFAPPLPAAAFLELLEAIDPPTASGTVASLEASRRKGAPLQSGPALRSLKIVGS